MAGPKDLHPDKDYERLHPGAQLYVSIWGDPVVDVGIGMAAEGTSMTREHLLPWGGATRLLLAVVVGQLLEEGALELDEPLGGKVAPLSGTALAGVTPRHLLTHTAGLPGLPDEALAGGAGVEPLVAEAPEYEPGRRARYLRSGPGRLLAELVTAVDGRGLEWLLRDRVWDPLGMEATYLGVGPEDRERLAAWISPLHWTGWTRPERRPNGTVREHGHRLDRVLNDPQVQAVGDPDLGALGPAHDLGILLEGLLLPARRLFRHPATATLLQSPQRVGLRDLGFGGARIPWGFGCQVGAGFAGTVGHRAFGHDGLPGGRALCDPAEGLVLVYLTNGLPAPRDDARRCVEVTDAVYEAVAPRPAGAIVTTGVGDMVLSPPPCPMPV